MHTHKVSIQSVPLAGVNSSGTKLKDAALVSPKCHFMFFLLSPHHTGQLHCSFGNYFHDYTETRLLGFIFSNSVTFVSKVVSPSW